LSDLARVANAEEFLENPKMFDFNDPTPNPTDYLEVREKLVKKCREFTGYDEETYKAHEAWDCQLTEYSNALEFYLMNGGRGMPKKEDVKRRSTQISLDFGNGDTVPFTLRNGDSDKNVLQQIFAQRDYDLTRLKRVGDILAEYKRIIASGRTPLIIDCGANIGASPIWFSKSLPEAKVFALEPERNNYEMLRLNCENHQNIACRNAAISCENETVYIQNPGLGSWGFRVSRESVPGRTAVRAVSIESIEKLYPESELFLVKIDIEGGESRLFESNLEWIDRAMLVIIELHDWMLPGSANSQNCLKALSERRRDFVFFGENVFSIRND